MAVEYVKLTGTSPNPAEGQPATGKAVFTLSDWLPDPEDGYLWPPAPSTVKITSGQQWSAALLPNDNPNIPPGSTWSVSITMDGILRPRVFSFVLNLENGAEQDIADLTPVEPTSSMAAYLLLGGGTMTGALVPAVADLTDAPVVAVNARRGNRFRLVLGGDRELATPSNPGDGQLILVEVIQDSAGGHSLTFSDGYAFLPGLPQAAITLTSTPGARNFLGLTYTAGLWYCLAFI